MIKILVFQSVFISCALTALVTHQYNLVHKDVAKSLETMIAPAWEAFASTAGGGNDDMECAVRCSQSATCAAFIMSGGSCHISAIAPTVDNFVDSNSTTSFYTKA